MLFLLKEFLDQLLPFILQLCNKSLSTGTLPPSQKRVIVMPRLKKKGMDLSDPGSFRPISNLSFLSKILEKIVVGQLMPYLVESDLLPKFQSGYRSHHSWFACYQTCIHQSTTAKLQFLLCWTFQLRSTPWITTSSFEDSEHPLESTVGHWTGWSNSFVVEPSLFKSAVFAPSGTSR